MEMPVDIILKHVGGLKRDRKLTGVASTDVSTEIDEELQRKFIFIPIEEIDAVEIEATSTDYKAGSGPETIRASYASNPNWVYNSAVNALAMQRHLTKLQTPVTDSEIQHAVEAVEFQLHDEQERDTPNAAIVRELTGALSVLQRIQLGGRA